MSISSNPSSPPIPQHSVVDITTDIKLLKLSCNSKYAVTYSEDGQLAVWEIFDDNTPTRKVRSEPTPKVQNIEDIFLDVSPDGRLVAISVHETGSPSHVKFYSLHIDQKIPKHVERLEGHGFFCSPELQTSAFVLVTFRDDHDLVRVYDMNDDWTTINEFYFPRHDNHNGQMPENNITRISLAIRLSTDQRFIDRSLVQAVSQGYFVFPIEREKKWKYSLQSWSIFDGSPQVTADLRVLSETIPVTSNNKQYKAVRMNFKIYIMSAISGCEIANISNELKWEPVGFVGIGDQWLVLRNQSNKYSVWQFNNPAIQEPMSLSLPKTSESSQAREELKVSDVIATTMHTCPTLLCISVAPSRHELNVNSLVIDHQEPDEFIKLEENANNDEPLRINVAPSRELNVNSLVIDHREPDEFIKLEENANNDIYKYEPWITGKYKQKGFKGFSKSLENPKRELIVGPSTVQLYNDEKNRLLFIWTLSKHRHIIDNAKISKDFKKLMIESSNIDNKDLNRTMIIHIPQCKLSETEAVVESKKEAEEALYISSSLLNTLIYLSNIKFDPWALMRLRFRSEDVFYFTIFTTEFTSDFFIKAITYHVHDQVKKYPSLLFHSMWQFFINWRLLPNPKGFWKSLKDHYVFASTNFLSSAKLPAFDKDLINENYNPAFDDTTGSNMLSTLGQYEMDITSNLLTLAVKRTNETKNVGYMSPITGVFSTILALNPELAISKFKEVYYTEAGSLEDISENFATSAPFATVSTYTWYRRFRSTWYRRFRSYTQNVQKFIQKLQMYAWGFFVFFLIIYMVLLWEDFIQKFIQRFIPKFIQKFILKLMKFILKPTPKSKFDVYMQILLFVSIALSIVIVLKVSLLLGINPSLRIFVSIVLFFVIYFAFAILISIATTLLSLLWGVLGGALKAGIDRFILSTKTWTSKRRYKLFIFPLPNLCVYYNTKSEGWPSFREWFFPRSPFTEICDVNMHKIFSMPLWEGVIDFKWRMFARSRFYTLLVLHVVILAIYAYTTSPMNQDQADGSSLVSNAIIYIQAVISVFFLLTEARQLIYYRWIYFLSLYNFIDIAAYGLVLVTSLSTLQLKANLEISFELKSVAMLLLWIRFMLQMRVYRRIGVFSNVVLDILFGILPFLFIIFFVLIAFSHALWILLNDPIIVSELNSLNITNDFQTYWNSAKYTYLALTQSYDGFTLVDNHNAFIDTYRAIFALVTGIILFNILIALLNSLYQNAFDRSENAYVMQKGQLISEIEIFYMFPWERRDPAKFPRDLIYQVEEYKLDDYLEKMDQKKLAKKSEENKKYDLNFFDESTKKTCSLSFEQVSLLEKVKVLGKNAAELERMILEMGKGKKELSEEGSSSNRLG